MRTYAFGLLACLLLGEAALGQTGEPMPLQVMPNSPASRSYGPGPVWQNQPAPTMAYPSVYPAAWQFAPNPNNLAYPPGYGNDYLPNPGIVIGPPLGGQVMLPPGTSPHPPGQIIQAKKHEVSCTPGAAACVPEAACPPAPCAPEPYLVETNPWEPVRINRYYAIGDYLVWWTKKQAIPAETLAGFPDFTLPDNGPRNGARLTLGAWLNPSKSVALEGSGFWLEDRTSSTTVNQGPNAAAVQLPFFLGIAARASSLESTSELWGAEVNARCKGCDFSAACCRGYVDFLAGFRYLNLSESLTFANTTLFSAAPVLLTEALVNSTDFVGTHNQFYAPQLGFETGLCFGRFNVSLFSKIALGINSESVNLNGQTVVTAPPLPLGNVAAPGGLLVQTPGHFSHEDFSYVSETGLNFSFKLCDFCQIGAGYSFLYLGNVVRPGDHVPAGSASQFPLGILTTQGTSLPAQSPFTFTQSNYWAQGANFRVTFIF